VTSPQRNFSAAALAICIVGLASCPVPLIVLGARSGEFRPVFYGVGLVPFLLGSGFLLWRYLSRPTERGKFRMPLLLAEGVAWLVIAGLLGVVSQINLLVGIERWGAGAESFLVMFVVSLPLVLRRRMALEQRLSRVPKSAAIAAVLVILATAAVLVIADLVTPARFI
jgi:hypothetical protein